MRRFHEFFVILLLATPACVAASDPDPGPDPDPDHPLAAWLGTWREPTSSWQWRCVDGPNVSYGTVDQTNISSWQITALDGNRIRAQSTASSRSWNYVVNGSIATLETGSFSGGANVDEPGNHLTLTRETLTRKSDGTLYNDVYYEYTSAIGESCTEAQQITLSR